MIGRADIHTDQNLSDRSTTKPNGAQSLSQSGSKCCCRGGGGREGGKASAEIAMHSDGRTDGDGRTICRATEEKRVSDAVPHSAHDFQTFRPANARHVSSVFSPRSLIAVEWKEGIRLS